MKNWSVDTEENNETVRPDGWFRAVQAEFGRVCIHVQNNPPPKNKNINKNHELAPPPYMMLVPRRKNRRNETVWAWYMQTGGNKHVRFQVLMAARIKMAVFWVVAPRNLTELRRRFRSDCCLHNKGEDRDPNDGGRKHLWNVG
jgi:hypothetical protein